MKTFEAAVAVSDKLIQSLKEDAKNLAYTFSPDALFCARCNVLIPYNGRPFFDYMYNKDTEQTFCMYCSEPADDSAYDAMVEENLTEQL